MDNFHSVCRIDWQGEFKMFQGHSEKIVQLDIQKVQKLKC